MSYLALARKWRPKRFEDVVGQQHVLSAMVNSLDSQMLHHAYLFCGTRGVGKTSLARLFAKSLNCERGVSSTPCGICSSCIEVDQGSFVDLLEIDAASRTKVEDTRELLDNVQYRPARGRYKVYLIDEVHMLSRHSFNALLKTLEEPPEHVKFLLATTDPQKLPVTVLSRCLQFQLKALTQEQILHHLQHIAQAESISCETRALELLAHSANGSMRDAQSLMDQALALGAGQIEYTSVLDMLGNLDPHHIKQLICYIVAGEAQQAFTKIQDLQLLAPDYANLHQQLAGLLHQVALAQVMPSSSHDETVSMLASRCDAELIQLLYQIVITGNRDLEYAPSPRSGFEMTVLRMLAFEPAAKAVHIPQELSEDIATQQSLNDALNAEQSEIQAQAAMLMNHSEQMDGGHQAHLAPIDDNSHSTTGQALPQAEAWQPIQHQPVEESADYKVVNSSAVTENAAVPQPTISSQETHKSHSQTAVSKEQQQTTVATHTEPQADTDESPTQALLKMRSLLRSQTRGDTGPKKSVDRSSNPASVETSSLPTAPNRRETECHSPQVEHTSLTAAKINQSEGQLRSESSQPASFMSQTQPLAMKSGAVDSAPAPDPWAELLNQMDLGPICRQIALNSLFRQNANQVQLLVKPNMAHLIKPSLTTELNQALNYQLGQEISLELLMGEDSQLMTPMEHQQHVHQYQLQQAKSRLMSSESVQYLTQRMGAELIEESVEYHSL